MDAGAIAPASFCDFDLAGLLNASEGDLARPSQRGSGDIYLHLISRQRYDGALLFSSGPVGPSTALDFFNDDLINHRIGSEIGNATLNHSLVFLGSSLHPVVGGKLWYVRTRGNGYEPAVSVECYDSIRIGAKGLTPAAIRGYVDVRDLLPGSDVSLAVCAAALTGSMAIPNAVAAQRLSMLRTMFVLPR
jgi:hypothetical protein